MNIKEIINDMGIFHEEHITSMNNLIELAKSPEVLKANEKIFYVFFFTENGECGVEPFIKDEKNKCFMPIHDDFLMSGERFIYILLQHEYVEDNILQDLINDDVLLPEEIAHALMSERDKKDAEFIEAIAKTWNKEEEKYIKNDIFECL